MCSVVARLVAMMALGAAVVADSRALGIGDGRSAGQGASASTPQLAPGPGGPTFEVKDGAFRTKKGRGWVHSEEQYTDFELEVEFRQISDKAETAIAMRVPTLNDRAPTAGCFVALPLPGGLPDPTKIVTLRSQDKSHPSRLAGESKSPAAVGAIPVSPPGQWQRVVVHVEHHVIAVNVNGRPLPPVIAQGPRTGYLGLESRKGTVEFRLFRVTRLATVPMCYSAFGVPVPRDRIESLDGIARAGLSKTPPIQGPKVLREVRPVYAAEAMRNKVQGLVVMEAVVRTDGTVGDLCVTRPLGWGLDLSAVKAARQWLFEPATREGAPIPVVVLIELTFTLR
jgi:TonB family protein